MASWISAAIDGSPLSRTRGILGAPPAEARGGIPTTNAATTTVWIHTWNMGGRAAASWRSPHRTGSSSVLPVEAEAKAKKGQTLEHERKFDERRYGCGREAGIEWRAFPRTHRTPTERLVAWGRGETDAFDRLVSLVRDELRRISHRRIGRGRPGLTARGRHRPRGATA